MGYLRRLLQWLRSPGEQLRDRMLHGGVWATVLNVFERALQLVQLSILTTLLPPSAFGLLGMAMITVGLIQKMTNLGLDDALIQDDGDDIDQYINTFWTMKLGRAVLIVSVVVLIAPLVSSFFNTADATLVVQIFVLTVLFRGATNPRVVYFKRDIEFHKQFLYRMSGTVADVLLSVALALLWGDVWAIVAGRIAGSSIRLLVSYAIDPVVPALEFDRERAMSMLNFGKWIWATYIVVFVATTGDDTFIGWFLSAGALGLYRVAFRLSNAPATEVTQIITGVLFPAYARMQGDVERIKRTFLTSVQIVSVVVVPMVVGVILVAGPFVRVILGPSWVPMIAAIQVLALSGLFRAVAVTGGALFKGCGSPEWGFRMNIVRAVVTMGTVWPLTDMWGITGTSVAVTLGLFASLAVWGYKTYEITGSTLRDYIPYFLISGIASAAMAGPVILVLDESLLALMAAIVLGAVTYTVIIYCSYRAVGVDIIYEIKRSFDN